MKRLFKIFMLPFSIEGIKIIYSGALFLLLCVLGSCKKLVEIPPPKNAITTNNVYTNDATAISVLTGVYTSMANNSTALLTGNQSISLMCGLSADELTLWSGVTSANHIAYYHNTLSVSDNTGSHFWSPFYNYIFTCNAALEGLSSSNSLTPSVKQQLQGEALFLRAFFYFYLANLFGDVPLALSSDYKVNAALSRASKSAVDEQIVADLLAAKQLLSTGYLDGSLLKSSADRVRPTKWAAMSLLARVYLYTGDWANAALNADSVISQSSIYNLNALGNVFLKNNKEAIWQLQPVIIGHNTEDAWTFIIPSTGPSDVNGTTTGNPVYLSNQLLNSFETGDQRRVNWVDSTIAGGITYYYPYKYKSATSNAPVTEYLMVFRLAEQYLIRAEARAQTNNIAGAQADVNAIRSRAGIANTIASDKNSLLAAIVHERQVELFTEWGHRWLDLKRSNTIDPVMTTATPIKANGTKWQSYQQLYPILFFDIQHNGNLVQNNGY